eukprot:jgi/Ulvmu1/1453/UM011_0183.1
MDTGRGSSQSGPVFSGLLTIFAGTAGHAALLALMLLSTGELVVPTTRYRKAWLPRVSVSQGLHVCQVLTTMVISGVIVGRTLVMDEGAAREMKHELLLFQLLCSFLAPLSSRCLDPDRARNDTSPALAALTRLSDAATMVLVASVTLQSTWQLPQAIVAAGITSCTIATTMLHQAALRQLPKTFTEGEAWLCVTLAANGALWLVATAAEATQGCSARTWIATALTRLGQLDTLPVVIALSTALFCCSAARPLRATVQQMTTGTPAPPACHATDTTKLCKAAAAAHTPAATGGIPPWPAGKRAPPSPAEAVPPRPDPQPATTPNRRRTALHLPAPPAALVIAVAVYAAVMCACAAATLAYVFATASRIAIVVLWALALAGAVPAMLTVARIGRVPHHILRKGFHLLCLALFIPVLLIDPPLLSLALAVAFVLLALAELVRTADIPRISAALTGPMTRFTDARDEGSFLVSHLSLLLGIAVPIWVSQAGSGRADPAPLTAWTGLVVLGLSDTVAATVGSLYGRVKVHQTSKKTAEGLLAAAAVTLAALGTVAAGGGLAQGAAWWLRLAWFSLLACVLEAVTLQLDNLVFAWHAFTLLSLLG